MQKGVEIIKHFESCKLKAYKDGGGVWTIGWGTTSRAGIGVTVGPGMVITQEQADEYLDRAVNLFLSRLLPLFKRTVEPHQLGAYLSLAYNIGISGFSKSTTLRRFNDGDMQGAADSILWWNKDNGLVISGLVRRRESERWLFLYDEVKV